VTRVGTILASNTSSISITRIASATSKPHRVTYESARSLAQHLGKSVCVSMDRPGFLVYRLLMPLINEAFFLLSEGVGTAEDIDRSMRLGTNMQSGPLRTADNI
ncbi:hypothetical protein VOLCADRAFT_101410, partial [Volvox carteri f. nagariensis]